MKKQTRRQFVTWGPPHDPYTKVPDEYKQRIPEANKKGEQQ